VRREHRSLPALLAVLFLAPAIAFADPTPEELDRAEVIAADALALFQTGELVPAAERFLEAYALSGRDTQLRNAAKAYEKAGKLEAAVTQWDRYAQQPQVDPEKRAQAVQHVAELRAQIESTIHPLAEVAHPDAPLVRPVIELDLDDPHTPRDLTPPPPPSPALRYGLIGGGSVAAVGGAVLVISGWATYASFSSDAGSVSRAEADAAGTRTGIGYALVGAAAVAGAILLIADLP